MKMKLYIAEKKEVARAISDSFEGKLQDGLFILPNGDKVTWLYGHLLRLADPEEVDERYQHWKLEDLPMQWPINMLPAARHNEHLQFVIHAIKQADELVHAGDPDPEGQRLVDEIIEYSGVHKTVYRILINDNNSAAIQKAVKQMESNEKYRGLSLSALVRAVGDQRYGYNLTRAYTLLAKKKGLSGVLSVGRVQTPILGLVVRRDRAIETHKATHYYQVKANLLMAENSATGRPEIAVVAQYITQDCDAIDEKGRLIDKQAAEKIAAAIKDQFVKVTEVHLQQVEVAAPLPYNLLALQADAAAKFGFTPKKVLEITQSLRDKHRAITYNRSDCRYLNEERHAEAPELLSALTSQYSIANHAEVTRRSKAFNSAKVTAHHAIIPTASVPKKDSLSQEEQQIYDLIVTLYIAQFYPPRVLNKAEVFFEIAGYTFRAHSCDEISSGWRNIIHDLDEQTEEPTENAALAQLMKGEEGRVNEALTETKETKPPKRYTMSTILKDLASVAKYVVDPKIKELLLDKDADKADEKGGIGTPATRDSHIETLFTRGYISEKGKQIISTELGRQLIDALPDFATTPDMTALWHEKQKQIEAGKLEMQALLDEIDKAIADEINRVCETGLSIQTDAPKCPNCRDGYLQKRKGQYGVFWSCNGYPKCKTSFPDNKGKPNLKHEKSEASKDYFCPKCQKGLIKRKAKSGSYWWGCSGFPKCDFRAFDKNGKPDIQK